MSAVPELYAGLEEAARTVREYCGSMPSRAFTELLNELEKVYLNELRSIAPDDLRARQACIRQIDALRRVLRGEDTTDGRC
jgi:hypothetical protein